MADDLRWNSQKTNDYAKLKFIARLACNAISATFLAGAEVERGDAADGKSATADFTEGLLRSVPRLSATSTVHLLGSRPRRRIPSPRRMPACSRRDMFHKWLKLAEREFRDVINALVTRGMVIETLPPAPGLGPRYSLAQATDEMPVDDGAGDE